MTDLPVSGEWGEVVIYHSQGRCLIVGTCEEIKDLLRDQQGWPANIEFRFLVTDAVSRDLYDQCKEKGYRVSCGRPVALQGYLGQFRVILDSEDRNGLGRLDETIDLVVDFSKPPLIPAEVTPFGYFVAEANPQRILNELDQWVGEFEKPKYFTYEQSLCAHGGQHRQGCRSCIEVCPARAVMSKAEKRIEVDPYLCQGCGDCATVCPSGALSYRTLPRKNLLEVLFARLAETDGAGVVFYLENERIPNRYLDPCWIRQPVPSVAACGPEVWLALIAAGASQVRLQRKGLPAGSRESLEQQMLWVKALLDGLGYGRDRIGWLEEDHREPVANLGTPGRMAAVPDKRDMLELALNQLIRQTERAPESIPLPQGAPIGTIHIDGDRCTLCFACVGNCPAQALQTSGDGLQFSIVEQNCLQCGWCVDVCPEDAIDLKPRLLTDKQRRRQPQVLHQQTPFNCLDCGKAFANQRMIEAVLRKIEGHPMFGDARKKRRLLLCDECRVRDIMRDHEM